MDADPGGKAMKKPTKCAGGFPGPCDNKPGTPWTPYWCPECDKKRMDGISNSLKSMLEELKQEAKP